MSNLSNNELHNKVFEIIKTVPTIMIGLNRDAEHSEPMHAMTQDTNIQQIWLFTDKDNRIASGGKSTAQYVNTEENIFASIIGQLHEETNEGVIKEIATPVIDSFFEDGILDKNLKVLRLDIESIEIWTQTFDMKTQFKLFMGMEIDPAEMGSHGVINLH